ncbi:hypothetical protein ES703_50599 [subsurface metagenome]
MVHNLGDAQVIGDRADGKRRLVKRAPCAVQHACLDLGALGQRDRRGWGIFECTGRNITGGTAFAGNQLDGDKEVGATGTIVQAVDGEDVVALPQVADVAGDGNVLEDDGRGVVVDPVGAGVPAWRAGELASGYNIRIVIKVGNKAVVVPHLQRHGVELVRVAINGERNADITGGIVAIHLRIDVEAEVVAVVSRAGFVADAAGAAGAEHPAQVIETNIPPTLADIAGWNEHSLGVILGHKGGAGAR